ncbi:hypothetical protein BN1013_02124 [Candidatus Rubidus massiliensis]|nr:hypothetical protein BN1013_02124 [Candidatus Rubidus massiliensis]
MECNANQLISIQLTNEYCNATGYSLDHVTEKLKKLNSEQIQNLQNINIGNLNDKVIHSIKDRTANSLYIDLAYLVACEKNESLAAKISVSPKLHYCVVQYNLEKQKKTNSKLVDEIFVKNVNSIPLNQSQDCVNTIDKIYGYNKNSWL